MGTNPICFGFPSASDPVILDIGTSAIIHADLEIQFAGQTAQYKQVAFQLANQKDKVRISGTIPTTVSDFKIDPPSLLSIAIKNEIPVHVDMSWRPQ